jgi:RNA polymerase sigma-70 factor (ECF subfamily)
MPGSEDPKGLRQLDEDIVAIANGDMDALRAVYESLRAPVYRFALSMLRNEEEAKDLMQDAFIRIRRNARLYRPRTDPNAWIYAMVRNLALNRLKSARRTVGLDDQGDLPDPDATEPTDRAESDVLRILSALKDDEREIVSLSVFAGLSHLEIARPMSMPYEAVRWKYAYAIRKLKKRMTREGGSHEDR